MKKSQISIGLSNPKNPDNVGAVMRAAGCFDVQQVIYTGKRYNTAMRFKTDTHRNTFKIPLTSVNSLLDNVPEGAKIICIELAEGAIALPSFQHPTNAFYLFGPEDGTLSQDLIDCADSVVYIPTLACLNLAATVNIVLYDRLAKLSESIASDKLIRHSRDRNNRVRVKHRN
ncbi:MAG: 23S rRNA methyltransferase [SAR86 cluster bacterium]|uniref:23S rRNA methyltransferase n=1 Tax=SAR86 cluster bacterium TaxID=2030880 RepID=A0A2A4MN66_9GAMM|nr:MAG: 23S rRNA methyltransferase [SAR86 cluster bacterium]